MRQHTTNNQFSSLESFVASDDASGLRAAVREGTPIYAPGERTLIGWCVKYNAVECLKIAFEFKAPRPEPSELDELSVVVGAQGMDEVIRILDKNGIQMPVDCFSSALSSGRSTTLNLLAELGHPLQVHQRHVEDFALFRRLYANYGMRIDFQDDPSLEVRDLRRAGWIALHMRRSNPNSPPQPKIREIIRLYAASVERDSEDDILLAVYEAMNGTTEDIRKCIERITAPQAPADNLPLTTLLTAKSGTTWATTLIQAGLPLERLHFGGRTHVDLAIERGDFGAAAVYGKAGVSYTGPREPLHTTSSHLTCVKRVSIREDCYAPVLACAHFDPDTLRDLLQEAPELLDQVARDGTTPLMYAYNLPIETVKILLEQGADPLKRDGQGWTALHHAAYQVKYGLCPRGVLEALIGAGLEVDDPDAAGRTPMYLLESPKDPMLGVFQNPDIPAQDAKAILLAAARQKNLRQELDRRVANGSVKAPSECRHTDIL